MKPRPKRISAKKEVTMDEEISNLLSGLHMYFARNPDKLTLLNQQVQQAANPASSHFSMCTTMQQLLQPRTCHECMPKSMQVLPSQSMYNIL
jgi:hypothetical protein